MSDALQTPIAETDATITVETPPVAKRALPMDKLTSSITLFSGVMPLTMTMEAMVEKVEDVNANVLWYVTLHLTGFGTKQRVFISDTVQVQLGVATAITFQPTSYAVGAHEYGLSTIGSTPGMTGTVATVRLVPMPGGVPLLEIINTTLDAQWVIGAIDILITDPPIIMEIRS